MKTVYVHRWTDDVNGDMEVIRGEVDHFLEGRMEGLVEVIRGLCDDKILRAGLV